MQERIPKITRIGIYEGAKQRRLEKEFKPAQNILSIIAWQGVQLEQDLKSIREFEELLKKTDSEK